LHLEECGAAQSAESLPEQVGNAERGGLEPEAARKLRAAAELPDLSDSALADDLGSWLGPHLAGLRSLAQVQGLDWQAVFR
jgi:ATP-dependent helicase HrpB